MTTQVEVPLSVGADSVFKASVKIPYKAGTEEIGADGSKVPLQVGAVVMLPDGFKLAPQDQGGQSSAAPEEEGDSKDKVDQGAISITFGRFNPPTTGHEALVKKVSSSAKGGEYRIYPSRSQDPKKNPLDPGAKIKFMKQSYPDHAARIMNSEETVSYTHLTLPTKA